MRIIIPMAGRGSRLRPHTLTTPKPLIPIAGKPIVHRLAEDITKLSGGNIEKISFITGDFGSEVNEQLIGIAESLGAEGEVYKQDEPLGTAHAIWMAEKDLEGPVIVAFADTLFRANFELNQSSDGVVWVKAVEDPSSFGVVKLDPYGVITDFVEKPKEFVSDLAIIGIYYFKDGQQLHEEIKHLMDNDIRGKGGEYQLTDALENMRSKGLKFTLGRVDDWMDCGNKVATVDTNSKILNYEKQEFEHFPSSVKLKDSLIIPPCHLGENVVIENSKIGPNVSLGSNTVVTESNISDSLIQENCTIRNGNLVGSMIGNHAKYYGVARNISLGDFSVLDFNNKDDK